MLAVIFTTRPVDVAERILFEKWVRYILSCQEGEHTGISAGAHNSNWALKPILAVTLKKLRGGIKYSLTFSPAGSLQTTWRSFLAPVGAVLKTSLVTRLAKRQV